MTTKTTKNFTPFLIALVALTVLMQYPLASANAVVSETQDRVSLAISSVDDEKKLTALDKAMNYPELQKIANGWKQIGVNYYGTIEPFEVTSIEYTMKLPSGIQNNLNCDRLMAKIQIDLNTQEVISKNIPNQNTDCNASLELGRPSDQSNSVQIPTWIPTASAAGTTSGYLIAEQGSSSGRYGGFGFITTPTIDDTNIYANMDQFVAFTYNQDIGNKYKQVGWIVTTVDGAPGSGIYADNKYMAYVDETETGNLESQKINIGYVENSSGTVYVNCSGSVYHIQLWHNSQWFSHPTSTACTATNTSSPGDNSVFMETKNTWASSNWDQDIDSTVKAWSFKEWDSSSSYSNWNSSGNKKLTCGDPPILTSTTAITGSLASGGTATWATISQLPDC